MTELCGAWRTSFAGPELRPKGQTGTYLSQKPVHKHRFVLPEAVHPENTLDVVRRVPRGIKDDYSIGSHEINSEGTRFSGYNKQAASGTERSWKILIFLKTTIVPMLLRYYGIGNTKTSLKYCIKHKTDADFIRTPLVAEHTPPEIRTRAFCRPAAKKCWWVWKKFLVLHFSNSNKISYIKLKYNFKQAHPMLLKLFPS